MSTTLISACWPLQMSPAQKAVLVSLADQANDDGVCWPAVGSISKRTCLSERAVQNAIRWLVEAGGLSLRERTGRSTVYTVTPASFAPQQDVRPADNAPTPASGAKTPAANAQDPAPDAPIIITEPSIEPIKNRKEPGVEYPDWLPAGEWSAFVDTRKKMKKPLTPYAEKLLIGALSKLRDHGQDAKQVIEQSIMNSWQGLFPVKDGAMQRNGKPSAHTNFKEKNYAGTPDDEIGWLNAQSSPSGQ